MLKDYKREQEQWAAQRRKRSELAAAWGEFIGHAADWDWLMTITFRSERAPSTARAAISDYLRELDGGSDSIGWALAEEVGAGGRQHFHLLIAGIRDQDRRFWCSEAVRRFGWAEVQIFDPQQGGAFYITKDIGKPFSNIELGGYLQPPAQRKACTRPNNDHPPKVTPQTKARGRTHKSLTFSCSITPDNPMQVEEFSDAKHVLAHLIATSYAADHAQLFDPARPSVVTIGSRSERTTSGQ